MNLLTIDTSLGYASVSLVLNGDVIAYSKEEEKTKQAETLLFHIEKVLNDTKTDIINLQYICASLGSGSFTGIRIGMATAIGLSYALKIPFLGLTTLETLAYKVQQNQAVAALIDASRGEFYFQKFNNNFAENEAIAISQQDVKKFISEKDVVICNKNSEYFEGLKNKIIISDLNASDYANLAIHKLSTKTAVFNNKSPMYIRPADAKISNKYNFV
jgi:tRNA threonylcarbamoyladenosine biosynthesis protein TsaB